MSLQRIAMLSWLLISSFIHIVLQTISAQDIYDPDSWQDTQRFTIEFHSNAGNDTRVEEDQKAFLAYLQARGLNVTVRYRYTHVFPGLSIQIHPKIDESDAIQTTNLSMVHPISFVSQALTTCPYVNRFWIGKRYARPRAFHDPSIPKSGGIPNLHFAHRLTGVEKAHKQGWTGQGIKVGILDTGIDYRHPALGGCFGKGCRVAYGHDLVGDQYGEHERPQSDPDPMDTCDGHGTHVAGILAGHDELDRFIGVAPNVTMGVWRIFGCKGDTDDDIILHGAEMAVNAGMDIINLSLGGGTSAWEEDALAAALSNIVDRGILVVVAQGNEGRDGIARTPSPSTGRHVLSIGSVDNSVKWGRTMELYNNKSQRIRSFEYLHAEHTPEFEQSSNYSVKILSNNACEPLLNDIEGSIVIVARGGCSFADKADHVQNANGSGILIYNDQVNMDSVSITVKLADIRIPVGSLSWEDGQQVAKLVHTNWAHFGNRSIEVKTGGRPSIFSTWGPDAELHLKPDIMGVGGFIYSTFPLDLGRYKMMSGTSMATPYISGCVALYMQATGIYLPASVQRQLLTYAKPTKGRNINWLESPNKQGAGLVQIDKSILSRTTISPSKFALNDTNHFNPHQTIHIQNNSPGQRTYHLYHNGSTSISGYDFQNSTVPIRIPKYKHVTTTVIFNNDTFYLDSGEEKVINMTFVMPPVTFEERELHLLYGGYVEVQVVSKGNIVETLHATYSGSLGNQRDLPIFDTKNGFPYITANMTDRSDNALVDSHMFDFRRDLLRLSIRLGSPSAWIKTELIDKDTDEVVGLLPFSQEHWTSRNDNSNTHHHHTFEWRGQVFPPHHGSVSSMAIKRAPPGHYRIRLSALKIFGDPDNDIDWEEWLSPPFVVLT